MDKVSEIFLPAGTRTIPLSEVPALLARALFPDQPEGPYVFKCLTKEIGNGPYRQLPAFEDAELALVTDIAGPPPSAGQPIGKVELNAYLNKFNTSPLRREWEIGASVTCEKLNADIARMGAEDEHRDALKKAIRSGSIVPLSGARLPLNESVREALDMGQIFVETFRDYASKFEVLVRVDRNSKPESITIEAAAHWLAGHAVDERVAAWFEEGRINDIRTEIAAAMTEVDVVHHALALAADGKLHPINSVTDLPAGDTFTPDPSWKLTESEMDLLASYLRPIATRKRIEADQDTERRDAGRYTLREAADAISAGTGERRKAVLTRLIAAARNNELPMYKPGSNLRLRYAEPYRASAVCDFYEEARWDELNEWLEQREKHVSHRFTDPSTVSAQLPEVPVAPAPIPSQSNVRPWVVEARRLADEIGLRLWTAGCRKLSQRDIAQSIAREWQDQPEYHGNQGPRDSNTIRTHALRGWKFRPPSGTNGSNGS